MECTNGVIQYSFRDKLADALSPEETRKAMKFSMSSIKNMEIPLTSETITFDGATADIMRDVRELYLAGAKRGDDEAYAGPTCLPRLPSGVRPRSSSSSTNQTI